jgi:hypothetical protein
MLACPIGAQGGPGTEVEDECPADGECGEAPCEAREEEPVPGCVIGEAAS